MAMAAIICTERHFEHNSLLLIRSLRVFGGETGSTMPIFSYSPRSSNVPTDECFHAMAKLGVHVVLNVHNPWPHYPLANKVVALAHAEQALPFETLVFFDSDQIVLHPLDNLQLGDGIDVAARPVDRKRIGFSNENDVWPYLGSTQLRNLVSLVVCCRTCDRERLFSNARHILCGAKLLCGGCYGKGKRSVDPAR
jgi:hypothetical protein